MRAIPINLSAFSLAYASGSMRAEGISKHHCECECALTTLAASGLNPGKLHPGGEGFFPYELSSLVDFTAVLQLYTVPSVYEAVACVNIHTAVHCMQKSSIFL